MDERIRIRVGTAALGSSVATAHALAAAGGLGLFEEGGYTGNAGRSSVAGIVHGQEYVLNADATKRYRGHLDAMNKGTWGGGGRTEMNVFVTNQAPGVEIETRRIDDHNMEIIARRVVQQMAPDVIAQDMRSPQSKTGRAMTETTNARRVRG